MSDPGWTIRPAAPGDAPGVAAIWNAAIRDTAVTFNSAEKSAAEVAELIAAGDRMFVAEDSGQVIGFARHFQFRGGVGYRHTHEHTILLDPAAQGRGLGWALMDRVEQDAREAGVHSLWAGVSGENAEGVAFHARLGFVEVARLPEVGHKFGRWMDLILMQKML